VKVFRSLAFVVTVATALAACGGAATPAPSAAPVTSATAAPAATATTPSSAASAMPVGSAPGASVAPVASASALSCKVPAGKTVVVGYATKSATNTGWLVINLGATNAAKDCGAQLITEGPQTPEDTAQQVAIMDDFIARHVNAIAIAPTDSAAVVPVVQKATTADIPVVAVDTAVNGTVATSFAATNNDRAASLAAQWLIQRVNGQAKVIMINGNVAQQTGAARRDGFLKYIQANAPGIQVVSQVATNWDTPTVVSGLESALVAHPEATVVYVAWGTGTVAAYNYIAQKGLQNKIIVTGFCSSPDCSQIMGENKIQGGASQFLYNEGYYGVQTAIEAALGQKVPAYVDTQEQITTPANVCDYWHKAGYLTLKLVTIPAAMASTCKP